MLRLSVKRFVRKKCFLGILLLKLLLMMDQHVIASINRTLLLFHQAKPASPTLVRARAQSKQSGDEVIGILWIEGIPCSLNSSLNQVDCVKCSAKKSSHKRKAIPVAIWFSERNDPARVSCQSYDLMVPAVINEYCF